MAGVKGKSGGSRKGAGRKKTVVNYDERLKKKVMAAINKGARDHEKRSIWDVGVDMIYDKEVQDSSKVGLFKIFKEVFSNNKVEVDASVSPVTGPGILLPEADPDPSGEIQ